MNILGIDVGEKRIGIARVNTIARLPEALEVVSVDGHELKRIGELIKEHQIERLVVGWPRNLKGEATAQTRIAEAAAEHFKAEFNLPVELQDEALTSVAAAEQGVHGHVDAAAAAIILEDYLTEHPA